MASFAASYDQECANCHEQIKEGDQVTYDYGAVVHVACAEGDN